MKDVHGMILVAIVAVVTIALRFLPFAIFSGKRQVPKYILYLGDMLPCAIMGMLIVYCLRGVNFQAAANWLPALIASLSVVGLHVWKRNTLLSIIGGTLLYMLLVQFIFV